MDAGLSENASIENVDSVDQTGKDKKKKNIAKDMKEKLSMLRWHGDSSPPTAKDSKIASSSASSTGASAAKETKSPKLTADVVISWSKSFDSLLADKSGLSLFREFLRSEYSDENLEFWIACEEYRTLRDDRAVVVQAQKIFADFVAIQAPREINLDSKTREETALKMAAPDRQTFEVAQKRIQALMAKDSYPRFLRSDFYRRQLSQFKLSPTLAAAAAK